MTRACPPDDDLRAFVGGTMEGPAQASVEVHIDDCASCRQRVTTLRSMATGTASTGLGSVLRALVATPAGARVPTVVPRVIDEQYEVVRELGRGGMGVVYLARDRRLDRDVAIKISTIITAASVQRVEREAVALGRLQHPNVVVVHQVGELDGRLYLAMEHVGGGNAREWAGARARTWREVIALYAAAGDGLAAAHAAGLVHRDFKPDNLLVGGDGRPRVADFGLVRGSGGGEPSEPGLAAASLSPSIDVRVTETGAVLGTPAYMAPEQIAGRDVDARADQFAFCASAWEALFGQRPFPGRSPAEVAAAIEAGPPRPPPGAAARQVPRDVVAALTRGLAHDRDARWPSMTPLLVALRRALGGRPRGLVVTAAIAAGAAAVVAVVAWIALGGGGAPAVVDPCTSARDRFAGVWDAPTAAQVRAAFVATGAAYAEPVYRETARQLDARVRAWNAMRTDNCVVTKVRREQSDAMMDVRAVCLEQRVAELGALVGELRKADAAAVRVAPRAAASVGDVSGCADVAALMRRAPPPRDPAQRAALDALERDLATTGARLAAGRYHTVADDGDRLIASARAVGYPPALAHALTLVARADSNIDRADAAAPLLDEAVLAAESGGDDEQRFDAELDLINVDGYLLEHDDLARQHAERAQALLNRLGNDPRRAGLLARLRAITDWWHGRYAEARVQARTSVELFTRVDPGGLEVARSLHMRAIVEQELADYQASVQSEEQALAIAQRALGPEHPDVAQNWETLGGSLLKLGRLDDSEHAYDRGLAMLEAAHESDEEIAAAMMNLGQLYEVRKDHARAIEIHRRALARTEAAVGPDHTRVAEVLDSLGNALVNGGRADEAIPIHQRALAIHRARLGNDAPPTAASLRFLGGDYLAGKDAARARPLFAESVRALEASQGDHSPLLTFPLAGLAEADLALHHAAAAAAASRRALALLGDTPEDAELRVELQATLDAATAAGAR